MIKCLIVDDEPLARELMASYVAQVPELSCVVSCASAVEAFSALHQQEVGVLFLDIEMPGISGLQFIRSLKKAPKVIFTTAYTEFAVEAFEVEAVDYLVKPVTLERFLKAVQKLGIGNTHANYSTPGNLSYIFLKVDRKLVRVSLADILFVEGFGDYLKLHTTASVLVTYMTMGKIEKLLPAHQFLRIHRSTIVNAAYIDYLEGNYLKVAGRELSIGATYREGLLQRLG